MIGPDDLNVDIERVAQIHSVRPILDIICRSTGMGFAAVARVKEDRWVACSVLDQMGFGLKAGGELRIETTICHEVRQDREAVVIDDVISDPLWCNHPTPKLYGFRSYISVPILLADGSFFGTLCAIDPKPADLKTPKTVVMFRMFAELIARQLDTNDKLASAESALLDERETAVLREQFIAVLGHDLRTPLRGIICFAELLLRTPLTEKATEMGKVILSSASRMSSLIDNLLDLARGRLAGGLHLDREIDFSLEPFLKGVIAGVSAGMPERAIQIDIRLDKPVNCDRQRLAQLLSNLLQNALSYGDLDQPIAVKATSCSEFLEISVKNAGDPIPPATAKRLFHPFYRNSMRKNREGLGLGLYIAHEVAVAHGGSLELESTTEATCFTFRMPLTWAEPELVPY